MNRVLVVGIGIAQGHQRGFFGSLHVGKETLGEFLGPLQRFSKIAGLLGLPNIKDSIWKGQTGPFLVCGTRKSRVQNLRDGSRNRRDDVHLPWDVGGGPNQLPLVAVFAGSAASATRGQQEGRHPLRIC